MAILAWIDGLPSTLHTHIDHVPGTEQPGGSLEGLTLNRLLAIWRSGDTILWVIDRYPSGGHTLAAYENALPKQYIRTLLAHMDEFLMIVGYIIKNENTLQL